MDDDHAWRFTHSKTLRFSEVFDPNTWPSEASAHLREEECDACGAAMLPVYTGTSTTGMVTFFRWRCPNGCGCE